MELGWDSMEHLVFVYGSLKRGFGNHDFMEGCKFVVATTTLGKCYRMISLGAFPAIISEKSGWDIAGELYRVDDLTLDFLDTLEGNGMFYQREQAELASGHTAWVYCLIQDFGVSESSNSSDRIKTKKGTQTWMLPSHGGQDFAEVKFV
jgi:gamma-glutamylcyclotransferase (GGCT)/AIG2-like uncharacterized protein YtfP